MLTGCVYFIPLQRFFLNLISRVTSLESVSSSIPPISSLLLIVNNVGVSSVAKVQVTGTLSLSVDDNKVLSVSISTVSLT